MTKESTIEKAFVARARKKGLQAVKFSDPGRRGAPDRIVLCAGGRAFFVEFKAPGKYPRLEQIDYHRKLRSRGFDVYVCDSVSIGNQIIDIYAL